MTDQQTEEQVAFQVPILPTDCQVAILTAGDGTGRVSVSCATLLGGGTYFFDREQALDLAEKLRKMVRDLDQAEQDAEKKRRLLLPTGAEHKLVVPGTAS